MSFRRKRKDVGADGDRAHVVALLVAVLVDSRVDDLLDAAGQRGHLGGIQAGGRRRDHGSLTPLLVLALERCGDPVHELLVPAVQRLGRSEEHTSELQSLMRISYAVFCLKKKTTKHCSISVI